MGRIILILTFFLSGYLQAQIPPGYTKINSRYVWIAGGMDSSLIIPRYNGLPIGLRSPWNTDGQIGMDTVNHRLYIYSGGSWNRIANYSEIGGTDWSLTGNAGTTPGTNFLGTTDSVNFIVKVNSIQHGLFDINRKNLGFGYNSLSSLTSLGLYNTAFGSYAADAVTSGDYNVAMGYNSAGSITTGNNNVAIGSFALDSVGIVFNAVAIGYKALQKGGGSGMIAIGANALSKNAGGSGGIGIGLNVLNNTNSANNVLAIGTNAMFSNVSATNDIAIGTNALYSDSASGTNLAIGYNALYNTKATFNTGVGHFSLQNNTTGDQNTAVGANSLFANTTATKNSAFGAGSLENTTTGGFNTGVGHDVLLRNTTGIENVGIGWLGWSQNRTGNYNVGIGNSSGRSITNGSYNTYIGANTGYNVSQEDTITNSIVIGFGAYATLDSQMVLGDMSTIKKTLIAGNNVGIGTATPASSSILDITSTTKGVLLPRLTGAQQAAISSPATGLIVYNTDSLGFTYYNGTAWSKIGSGGGSSSLSIGQTITSATSGSILFAGSGGKLSQINSKLFYDSTNGRVGIGTDVPMHTLDVQGGFSVGGGYFAIDGSGNISANANDFYFAHSGYDGFLYSPIATPFNLVLGDVAFGGNGNVFRIDDVNSKFTFPTGKVGIGTNSPTGTLHVVAAATDALFVDAATGNVGIGTNTPTQALDVNGNINIADGGYLKIGGSNILSYSTGSNNALFAGAYNFLFNNGGNVFFGNTNQTYFSQATGDLYFSSTSSKVGVGTASPNQSVDINGSFGAAITTTTGNLTLDGTHHTVVITGSTPTITLPAAASGNSRRIYVIVNQTGAGRTISSYLDFAGASATTVAANSSITIQSNGTSWYRIL